MNEQNQNEKDTYDYDPIDNPYVSPMAQNATANPNANETAGGSGLNAIDANSDPNANINNIDNRPELDDNAPTATENWSSIGSSASPNPNGAAGAPTAGAGLTIDNNPDRAQIFDNTNNSPKPHGNRKLIIILLAVIGGILILAGVFLLFIFPNLNSKTLSCTMEDESGGMSLSSKLTIKPDNSGRLAFNLDVSVTAPDSRTADMVYQQVDVLLSPAYSQLEDALAGDESSPPLNNTNLNSRVEDNVVYLEMDGVSKKMDWETGKTTVRDYLEPQGYICKEE
jgi:hypothetical protein